MRTAEGRSPGTCAGAHPTRPCARGGRLRHRHPVTDVPTDLTPAAARGERSLNEAERVAPLETPLFIVAETLQGYCLKREEPVSGRWKSHGGGPVSQPGRWGASAHRPRPQRGHLHTEGGVGGPSPSLWLWSRPLTGSKDSRSLHITVPQTGRQSWKPSRGAAGTWTFTSHANRRDLAKPHRAWKYRL